MLNLLATVKAEVGDLSRVTRFVKVVVFVNSAPHYTEQHLVADGATDLLVRTFGDRIGSAGPIHSRGRRTAARVRRGDRVHRRGGSWNHPQPVVPIGASAGLVDRPEPSLRIDSDAKVMPTGARHLGYQAIGFARCQPHHRLCLSDSLPAASMPDVGLAEPSVASLLPNAGLPG